MQAITTDYMPNTGRIKVQCAAKTAFIHPPDMVYNDEQKHVECVKEFLRQLDKETGAQCWVAEFVTGQMKDGRYVHVFTK